MTTLYDLIREKQGYQKQSNNCWEGPCPKCGSQWRMIVWIHKDMFKCQACDFKGDLIKWLRDVEGYSCREAFLEAGRDCGTPSCAYYEKCKGNTARKARPQGSARPPKPKKADWEPRPPEDPEELWQQKAAELVDWAHEQLLGAPDRLAYLAGRGLPLEAVKRYRLGWNPGEERKGKAGPLFRARSAWGLPDKWDKDKDKWVKTLVIQRGYLIPSFVGDEVYRVRIRRPDEDLVPYGPEQKKPAKYIFLEGSGKGVIIRNPEARAFLIVESDFDDLLLDLVAGDLICSVPLTSCSIRPDAEAAPILARAVVILNALDYDARTNRETGKYENPGGEAARWWERHFPQTMRWPPPTGKDPGDAYKEGVDLREWVIAGLPVSLQPRGVVRKREEEKKMIFDTEKAFRLLKEHQGRVASIFDAKAWEWVSENVSDAVPFIRRKEAEADACFDREDEARLIQLLAVIEDAYRRVNECYAQRPPVIDIENDVKGETHVS